MSIFSRDFKSEWFDNKTTGKATPFTLEDIRKDTDVSSLMFDNYLPAVKTERTTQALNMFNKADEELAFLHDQGYMTDWKSSPLGGITGLLTEPVELIKYKRDIEKTKKEMIQDIWDKDRDRANKLILAGTMGGVYWGEKESEKAFGELEATDVERFAFTPTVKVGFTITGMKFVSGQEATNLLARAAKTNLTRQNLIDITSGKIKSGPIYNQYKALASTPEAKKELMSIAQSKSIPLKTRISDTLKSLFRTETPVPPKDPLLLESIPKATTKQIQQAHIIAKNKLMVDSITNKVKPQYRALAKGMTGKTSMKSMTIPEADDFINALDKIKTRFIKGIEKPPKIPKTKAVVPEDFFKREYSEPGLMSIITPSDTYARKLGVYEHVESLVEASKKMSIEKAQIDKWFDKLQKEYLKLEQVPFTEKAIYKIKNKPTEAHTKLYNLLDKHETAKEAGLTGPQANIFNELRGITNAILERTNEVRETMGLEPVNKLSGYITHIRDIMGRAEIRAKYPLPEDIKYWLDKINPKHIFNPTQLQRIVKDPDSLLKDPFRALKAMTSMDLKQIYLEKPNFVFAEQMNALKNIIPASTRKWTEAWVKETILGYPTELDMKINITLDKMGVTRIVDKALEPFGRKLGTNPIKEMTGALSRIIHDAAIWGRAKLLVRNMTQRGLALGLYDTPSFIKGLLPANRELDALIKNSDFFKISNREFMEALPEGVLGKLERAGFVPYGRTHISNVRSAMKTSYHWGKKQIAKTANLPDGHPAKWTMDDVIKEMDFGANTTQYWYNLTGMPELYRSGIGRIAGVLQSWWQNYTTKYWSELLARTFKGQTGWGKPLTGISNRIGALRHIIGSYLFIKGVQEAFDLNYSQIALLGALPTILSPPGQIALGLYQYITADNDYQKNQAKYRIKASWKAFIPGSMAWRDFQRAFSEGSLRELLFYTNQGKKQSFPAGMPTTDKELPSMPGMPTMPTKEDKLPPMPGIF
jgi:hypothetical protein